VFARMSMNLADGTDNRALRRVEREFARGRKCALTWCPRQDANLARDGSSSREARRTAPLGVGHRATHEPANRAPSIRHELALFHASQTRWRWQSGGVD
jgi:hypothetical protein